MPQVQHAISSLSFPLPALSHRPSTYTVAIESILPFPLLLHSHSRTCSIVSRSVLAFNWATVRAALSRSKLFVSHAPFDGIPSASVSVVLRKLVPPLLCLAGHTLVWQIPQGHPGPHRNILTRQKHCRYVKRGHRGSQISQGGGTLSQGEQNFSFEISDEQSVWADEVRAMPPNLSLPCRLCL